MRAPSLTPQGYRRVTFFALLALAGIIVTGASVRLTGSGLGCPDWPTCEKDRLVAPLELHPMIEFVNRTITGLVTVAVILAVLGSLARVPRRRDLTWWSFGLVAGLIAQIVVGGLTVLFDLTPPFVMAHFLLSIVAVWNAVMLFDRAGRPDGVPRRAPAGSTARLVRVTVGWSCVVLFAGTVVTGAGPHGGDEHVKRLDLDISTAARIHGITVMVLLGLTLLVARHVFRTSSSESLRWRVEVLLAVIVGQGIVGYTQYFLDVPTTLVLLHVAGSVAVFISALRVYLALPAGEELERSVDEGEVLRGGEVIDALQRDQAGVR